MIEAWQAAAGFFIAAIGCWYCALVVQAQLDNWATAMRIASALDKIGAILVGASATAALIELLK